MFDLIFKPLTILMGNTKKLSHRVVYFCSVLLLMFLLNDYTGFLHNYKVNSKLEQLKALKDLGVNDEEIAIQALSLKEEIVNRETIWETFGRWFHYSQTPMGDAMGAMAANDTSLFNWRTFSASIVVFLLMLFIFVAFLFREEKDSGDLALLIWIQAFGLALCALSIYLLNLIPDWGGWNHVINVVAQVAVLLGVYFIIEATNKN